jgi:uncharacterized protein (DUF2147 family)
MTRISLFDLLARNAARVAISVFALCAVATSADAAANDPHGVWMRPEGGEQFSFYDCGGLLCAKLISVKKSEDQASVGTVILRGAVKSGANEWKGKLYNAEDGKTYDGFITVKTPNELTLKGCLWGVLCSGETWKRVGSAPASPSAAAAKPNRVAAVPAE